MKEYFKLQFHGLYLLKQSLPLHPLMTCSQSWTGWYCRLWDKGLTATEH